MNIPSRIDRLDAKLADAIIAAADEVLARKHDAQFIGHGVDFDAFSTARPIGPP